MTVPHPERVGESGTPARAPARTASPWHGQGPVVAAVSLGGAIGASARYGAGLLWPTPDGGFPWTTFTINVVGCAVIGVLMVLITDMRAVHRLARPFFGTGVLGGFTTFSTYAVDIRNLVGTGHPGTGLGYLAATLCAALAAVWLGTTTARRALARRRR
ncbi:fluoride efflux transporter CrcB [Streptomyces sp. NBC_00386]|jgi:CrcB protein|uniref:fluoride efflux transporter CrcB n=1 Tax=Streptomyces sp. NBC_00386 TaxID=2975734 RepID=UPI002E1E532E